MIPSSIIVSTSFLLLLVIRCAGNLFLLIDFGFKPDCLCSSSYRWLLFVAFSRYHPVSINQSKHGILVTYQFQEIRGYGKTYVYIMDFIELLWDSTSVGEENETPSIRVWKPLPSIHILKILRGSLKGKAQREQYLGLSHYK